MSGYVDVEGMRTAASNMSGAAHSMKDAASWFGEHVMQMQRAMQDHQIAMSQIADREIALLACRTELEQMIAHDAGMEGQAGRYAESAYEELRKRIVAL